jgi:AcrR family transcriptional regulator
MQAVELKNTPLAAALANPYVHQITPLDAFRLARKYWLSGKRLSICELAKDLGISRGKLYHWVGNKEWLIDEIIWSVAKPTFERAIEETPGQGIDHIVGVHRFFINAVLTFKPLQQFVNHDPPYALRILSTDAKQARTRLLEETASHIDNQARQGHIQLCAPAETIAEMIIHTNEALVYHDILSGRTPAIEQACAITRLILSAGKLPKTINA